MESRDATRVRARMSRPRLSVPAQCSGDGVARTALVSTASALVLQSAGPSTARTATATRSTAAVSPTGVVSTARHVWARPWVRAISSALPDHRARVEEREGDVDGRVDHQHTEAVD